MLELDAIRQIIQMVLSASQAEQTEVTLIHEEQQLTRFADSRIHQNVAEQNAQVRVRVAADRRVGLAATNDLSPASLKRVSDTALQMAQLAPEDPDFLSLPVPQPIPSAEGFVKATAACTPQQRAQTVGVICRLAQENGLAAAGAFSISTVQLAVSNSLGVFAYAPLTSCDLTTVMLSPDSSGYAGETAMDVRALDAEKIGREAIHKALLSRSPQPVEPGIYSVFLEEYAVAELVSYLSILGFGALAYLEGRSFLSNRLGQLITGTNISIWDDGLDPSGLVMPFDYEGMPKRRVDLITAGVACGMVHDSVTAMKTGQHSTGHAQPKPALYIPGPQAGNLFMQPGNLSKEEMLASMKRGIFVTRFHYVSPVEPAKTVLTGMTRDGTFWVEEGRIQRPLRNLRFTQNVLEALKGTIAISRETRLRRDTFGAIRAPALLLEGFNFTGVGEF